MKHDFEIIDFHTHPFLNSSYNICKHKEVLPDMGVENTFSIMKDLGVSKICGAVVSMDSKERPAYKNDWQRIRDWNTQALELKKIYGDFYVPGFHIHPDFVEESCLEIDRMHAQGVRLLGELVPYLSGYKSYSLENMKIIIDYATQKKMVVSIHTTLDDDMDTFVEQHPDTTIVAAHPNEYDRFMRHLQRLKKYPNYYLDISGTGVFRYGMLRRAIDEVGAHKILYGSDFPTCNPGMFVGSVLLDPLITAEEKRAVFAENAKRLLGIE
jgi:predicted TIM-barrel fold metal-dependent hydrolase